jgi:hypothetical protein
LLSLVVKAAEPVGAIEGQVEDTDVVRKSNI